jgi:hypothetical protein
MMMQQMVAMSTGFIESYKLKFNSTNRIESYPIKYNGCAQS